MTLEFMATTIEGLEDVAAKEVEELGGSVTEVGRGRVFLRGSIDLMYRLNIKARCIHKLVLVLSRGNALNLSEIYRFARAVDYFDIIRLDQTFAVKTTRIGSHDYTSIDVSATVGQAIIDNFMETKSVRPHVNLTNPDVEIDVYIKDLEITIGVNTTGESLHKRNYRVYDHPAALKTTIASGMIRLSGWRGDGLLDPMCGGGTIVIEATLMARKFPPGFFRNGFAFTKLPLYDPKVHKEVLEKALDEANRDKLEVQGFDISPKHVEGAKLNALSAGVSDTINFRVKDSRKEDTYVGLDVNTVIVNPPYGIRQSRLKVLKDLYSTFLKALSNTLSGSTLTIIVAHPRIFEDALNNINCKILELRSIKHGNLPAKIYRVLIC
ncbi:MAG: tRNA (guanine(6)-N2)-methyltransferase [Candidatus Nezhaarchaeales archaeon]